MKWLLYILLLANLATFFWHYQPGLFRTELSQQPQVDAEGASIPQLVLLREYQAKQQTGRNSTVAVESCFNLGPFAQRKAALQISQQVKALGVSVSIHMTKDKSRPGYWVLIPASKDRKAARQVIERLKEKKIKDYFLVATGSQKNAISLGVFSRADLAQKQLKIIKKLGFNVSVTQVDLPKREYWLEWSATSGSQVGSELLSRWYKQYPGIGSTRIDCHEISPSG